MIVVVHCVNMHTSKIGDGHNGKGSSRIDYLYMYMLNSIVPFMHSEALAGAKGWDDNTRVEGKTSFEVDKAQNVA